MSSIFIILLVKILKFKIYLIVNSPLLTNF